MAAANHQPNRGIMSYWPQIFGIASFVFTAGIVYGKFGQMEERQKAIEAKQEEYKKVIENRQDRQFELYQGIEKRMIEQEKSREYYRGVREGRAEVQGVKKAE